MFPSAPRRRAALAVLATAAALPAFAGGAQASLGPVTGTSATPVGQVTLETVWSGFTIPSDGVSSARFTDADTQFTWYQGKVGAHVTGTLHVDNGALAQFRVRVDSLTVNNDVLGSPVYNDKADWAINSSSQDVPIDVTVPSLPDLGKVKISVEEKSNTPKWVDRGDLYAAFHPRTDDVTILSRHLDVGGNEWDKGAPLTPASVTWAVGDDGALTATYRGYLHLQGLAGSARVELRAIDPFTGRASAIADGTTRSSDGSGHEMFPTDVRVPETIPLTSYSPTLDVVIQSWVSVPGEDGHWDDIASQRISAGDGDN
jgi:hypothetical protein